MEQLGSPGPVECAASAFDRALVGVLDVPFVLVENCGDEGIVNDGFVAYVGQHEYPRSVGNLHLVLLQLVSVG